jgi:hypothetical protein
MTAQQFVEQGADEIQHINMVFLNFLAKEVPDTRNMNRFQAIGSTRGHQAGRRARARVHRAAQEPPHHARSRR